MRRPALAAAAGMLGLALLSAPAASGSGATLRDHRPPPSLSDLSPEHRRALDVQSVSTVTSSLGVMATARFGGDADRALGSGLLSHALAALVVEPASAAPRPVLAAHGPDPAGETLGAASPGHAVAFREGSAITFFILGRCGPAQRAQAPTPPAPVPPAPCQSALPPLGRVGVATVVPRGGLVTAGIRRLRTVHALSQQGLPGVRVADALALTAPPVTAETDCHDVAEQNRVFSGLRKRWYDERRRIRDRLQRVSMGIEELPQGPVAVSDPDALERKAKALKAELKSLTAIERRFGVQARAVRTVEIELDARWQQVCRVVPVRLITVSHEREASGGYVICASVGAGSAHAGAPARFRFEPAAGLAQGQPPGGATGGEVTVRVDEVGFAYAQTKTARAGLHEVTVTVTSGNRIGSTNGLHRIEGDGRGCPPR